MVLDTVARPTGALRRGRSPSARVDEADVLVFAATADGFSLRGGSGRGQGWAGIVEVARAEAAMLAEAWRSGSPVRLASDVPRQVAGPYHASRAAAVPVGHGHVVVFGPDIDLRVTDVDLIRRAADAVNVVGDVPAEKLLGDELELVAAVRALMAYRPQTLEATLEHIALVAGRALSCDVAAIEARVGDTRLAVGVGVAEGTRIDLDDRDRDVLADVSRRATTILEQAPPDEDRRPDIVSRLAVPVGSNPTVGALLVGHAIERPRGFTALCQRIGRALGDAAEILVTQAVAREELARERDLLAHVSRTDPLTGLANRRRWDEAAATGRDQAVTGYVMSADVDGLKPINDAYGHASGDAVLRAVANLLRTTIRETDLLARIGGDEFVAVLRGDHPATPTRVRRRVRRAERRWRVTEFGLTPSVSLGFAGIVDGDLEAARAAADAVMYANKRRRAGSTAASRRRTPHAVRDRRGAAHESPRLTSG